MIYRNNKPLATGTEDFGLLLSSEYHKTFAFLTTRRSANHYLTMMEVDLVKTDGDFYILDEAYGKFNDDITSSYQRTNMAW